MIAVSRLLPDISGEQQQQQYCACGARRGVLTQRVYTGKARKTDPIQPPLTWRPTGRFKHASAAFPTSRPGGQSEMPRGRRFASNRPRPLIRPRSSNRRLREAVLWEAAPSGACGERRRPKERGTWLLRAYFSRPHPSFGGHFAALRLLLRWSAAASKSGRVPLSNRGHWLQTWLAAGSLALRNPTDKDRSLRQEEKEGSLGWEEEHGSRGRSRVSSYFNRENSFFTL